MIDPDQPYTLAVACELIPMPSIGALYQFLFRFKSEFPGLYRRGRTLMRNGSMIGVEQRFMTGAQILKARQLQYHGWEESRYARRVRSGRPRGTGAPWSHPLSYIMEQARA